MKFFVLIAAALSVVNAYEKVVPFVTGGTDAPWGQFAAAVIIDGPNEFCGGTIIDRSHILTSVQCMLNENYEVINPMWYKVIAGDIFFSPPSSRRIERNITRIFIHPQYNPFTGENDLAVLRLDRSVPFPHNTIETAVRGSRIVQNGFTCQLVAFGRPTAAATAVFRTRQIMLNQAVMDRDVCSAVNTPNANRLGERMMCTQTMNNASPCSGNLGSGLYCNGQLTGVLTGGIGCGIANNPAVYQQVRGYNNWIEQQFTRSDNPIPGNIPFPTQGLPIHIRRSEN